MKYLVFLLILISCPFDCPAQQKRVSLSLNNPSSVRLYPSLPDQQEAEKKKVIKWLKTAVHPIQSLQANQGVDDLQALKKTLAGVQVVGLGEATHGSREFFQLKHRLVAFLVEQMGFTLLGMEASYSRCAYVNTYVLTGKGSLDTAVAMQGSTTYRTEEIRALIEWMRRYNQQVVEEKKVQFVGYDLQVNDRAAQLVSLYCHKVDKERSLHVDSLLTDLIRLERGGSWGKELLSPYLERTQGVMNWLTLNKGRFISLSSAEQYEQAWQHMRLLQQYCLAMGEASSPLQKQDRDYFMAENISYIHSRQPAGTKMIVWAHNGHISKDLLYEDVYSMGHYLKQSYGEGYYAIGFDFYQGSFQANDADLKNSPGWEIHRIGPAGDKHFGWYGKQTGLKQFYLDIPKAASEAVVDQWLAKQRLVLYSIGSRFSKKWPVEDYTDATILANTYDGVIYIENTTPANPTASLQIKFELHPSTIGNK